MATFRTYTCTAACRSEDGWAFAFNSPVEIVNDPRVGKYEDIRNAPTYHQEANSDRYAVHCPRCDKPAEATKKHIHGKTGKTACESFCETATGGSCNCSCGGLNHGVRA